MMICYKRKKRDIIGLSSTTSPVCQCGDV